MTGTARQPLERPRTEPAPDADRLRTLADMALSLAKERGLTLVTAESCTAGLVAARLSDAPGAAEHLLGGFVTYTKVQKAHVLRVSPRLLSERTAVCPEVACAMAQGALRSSPADLAIAVTGVAGPEPDEDGNPVGLICVAAVRRGQTYIERTFRFGERDRADILALAVAQALELVIDMLRR